ncbi:MAG: nuclear transport factor 2 family protein [bacterium]|nr:nuclear transport factor 2 family protein [bacterium]
MKKTRLIALALTCMLAAGSGFAADPKSDLASDRAAIEAAARDYIDGWYEGNAERMARALHPDLAKRTIRGLPSGRGFLQTLSSSTMIEYTKAGFGKESKKDGQVNEVIILDQLSASASVKTISHEFTDYLHLAKINGEWRIVNVLWEPLKK